MAKTFDPMIISARASASLSVLYEQVYISDSSTVARVTTNTQIAIGYVTERSRGGAGTPVGIALYRPLGIGIAGAAIVGGTQVAMQASLATFAVIATNSGIAGFGGIAFEGAAASQTFSFFPIYDRIPTVV